ncbi:MULTISPECIES: thiamine pyrophosphate-binding protein [Haloferax]|uniref:Rieske 2Fe-2S domain-containing protein n=2 Tax=Haloferax TaxID=2251 RepID=A0A6G1Z2L9_9EURY|nr:MULTISPECIES: thiamine pyrophosphate-binding protein [Haloferax]KAB1188008.1 Rieske 2Fe-2S domain-containing protein [Haloferax sp. CBA1149]MRW80678.1 Rieske 2Fe-2S domain-containing protein [Haloferax marinisediminis]
MTNESAPDTGDLRWHKALDPNELPEGRVTAVSFGGTTVCMTHYDGQYAAIDNACPHQGGPLGEGSIEKGLLRCPWHGWDFDPLTGQSPGDHDDCTLVYAVEERDDGIYVGLPPERVRERTVSDVMVETMTAWGVSQVWGIVGHSNLGLADAFREASERGDLSYYGVRHEGAAAFAASAYGKLTGEPAACFAIAGPGATNLLTGLWDANVDRAPVLALTGQVATQVLGTGNFQEVDLEAAYGDVALFEQTVLPNSDHAELMTRAAKTALLEGGVSHLVFPDEVQTIPADGAKAGSPEGRLTRRDIAPPSASIQEAVDLLADATRPLIIVGHGARFDMDRVVALAEHLDCPVVTTFKAKGQLSDTHPLAGGVLGRSGTPIASHFMNESDLLLVFGASFSNHTGISEYKRIVHVDHDPMVLGKHHSVDVPVWGDVGVTVDILRDRLNELDLHAESQRAEVAERWDIWRAEKATRRDQPPERGVNYATVFDAMSRLLPENAIVPVDVGNNTYAFGRYFECTDHTVLMSGYLGSIGFAFPAALGAWAATREPDSPFAGRPVVSVSSDGGFGQYMGELTTAVKYDMNLTHVLLTDDELGKISKEQRDGGWPVWQTDLVNPDFAAYAENCGARGFRVESPAALEPALEDALSFDGPALVEVLTDANPV